MNQMEYNNIKRGIKMSSEDFQNLVLESLKDLKDGQKGINTKLDEQKQLLEALEHRTDVNGAEVEKISIDMAHIQGDIKNIKSDTKSITDVLSIVEQVTAQNWADISKIKKAQ